MGMKLWTQTLRQQAREKEKEKQELIRRVQRVACGWSQWVQRVGGRGRRQDWAGRDCDWAGPIKGRYGRAGTAADVQ